MDTALRLDDLFDDIAKGGKGMKSLKDVELQLKVLRSSWSALDSWITATMKGRRGVHIPSLCKMTWEFLDAPGNETMPAALRARPVFILTDAFIRGLRLATFRKPELPALCAPCVDLNLSSVAIKHSENLTKDVLFVALVSFIIFTVHTLLSDACALTSHPRYTSSLASARHRSEGH